jgi:hypothetical protein
MSKTISYRGQLPIGVQDRIRLKTINGKIGYKITKLQIIPNSPGDTANVEGLVKVFKVDQTGNIVANVDFTDSDLLACSFYKSATAADKTATTENIIFDNEKFNQDIFIYAVDQAGGTVAINYYMELETMNLSDLETTMLTLKSLRTVTSR